MCHCSCRDVLCPACGRGNRRLAARAVSTIRERRGRVQVRFSGHRVRRRDALLDLAGASTRLCRQAAATGRLRIVRLRVGARPRAADWLFHRRALRRPAYRHQLRVLPHRRVPSRAGRPAADCRGRPRQSRESASVRPLPPYRRRRSALQRRRAARGDRRHDAPVVDAADAVSMAAHSRHPARAATAEAGLRVDGSQSRLGPRAHRSVQSGQVRHSQTADRQHHRELRHGAAVEPEAAAGEAAALGWADDLPS